MHLRHWKHKFMNFDDAELQQKLNQKEQMEKVRYRIEIDLASSKEKISDNTKRQEELSKLISKTQVNEISSHRVEM